MKHKTVKVNEFFQVKGTAVERNRKNCPRCGDGTFMAFHKTRYYCGKCRYTEFLNSK